MKLGVKLTEKGTIMEEFLLVAESEHELYLDLWPDHTMTMRPRDAERLGAVLMQWAEKGYLPDRKEVWE